MPLTRRCLEIIKSIKNWPQWQVSDWNHVKFECYALQFLSNFEIEIINLSSGTEAETKNVAYKNKSHESLESSAHDFLYVYGFWMGLKLFSVSVLWVRLFIAWILLLCVCVCVCLYSSTVEPSSDCKTSETYLRDTDQRCDVVSIIPCASASSFISISKCVTFHLRRRNSSSPKAQEKTI